MQHGGDGVNPSQKLSVSLEYEPASFMKSCRSQIERCTRVQHGGDGAERRVVAVARRRHHLLFFPLLMIQQYISLLMIQQSMSATTISLEYKPALEPV